MAALGQTISMHPHSHIPGSTRSPSPKQNARLQYPPLVLKAAQTSSLSATKESTSSATPSPHDPNSSSTALAFPPAAGRPNTISVSSRISPGTGDIVGFSNGGVIVSLNNDDNTFQPPKLVLPAFGRSAGGWHVDKHPRFLCDLRKTGRADVVGFSHSGVEVALNNGGGSFGEPFLALNSFGYEAGGWRVEKHPRFLADTTGDGYPDIVGFANDWVFVAKSTHDGKFETPIAVINGFGYEAGGWRIEKHPRFVADLTGDAKADLVGFANFGVYVALNNGDGTFQAIKMVVNDFGYEQGWRVEKHPRFIADLTGDGRGDIVGFWDTGVYVSYNNGNGTFKPPKLVLKDFGYNSGWHVDMNPRFLADLNGDGRADIVGFGDDGVYVALNDGQGGFSSAERIVRDFGYNAGGWRVDKHVRYPANIYRS